MSESENSGLIESFWATVGRNKELRDLEIEYAGIALDAVWDEGVLKDIPFFGTLVKLGKAGLSIRDRLYARKILRFLLALDAISDAERKAQIERLVADPRERQRVGEQLILLLDRLNDMEKPALLARAFQAYLEAKIDYGQFMAIANAIDVLNVETIMVFRDSMARKALRGAKELDYYATQYLHCGLLTMSFNTVKERIGPPPVRPAPQTVVEVSISDLGKLFYTVVLEASANTSE